jgi:hypothetical protein
MHMIKKGQLPCSAGLVVSDGERFYSLATCRSEPSPAFPRAAWLLATGPMIKKNQLGGIKKRALSAVNQFYSLAF